MWWIFAGIAAAVVAAIVVGLVVVHATRTTPVPVACTRPDAVRRAIDAVSQDRIRANLQQLVNGGPAAEGQVGSRHVSTPGNATAVSWIGEALVAAGVPTREQPFRSGGRALSNVVATVAGSDPGLRYGVGAHLDSTSEQVNMAPGADDDASGVAAVIEAARVIGTVPQSCLRASIDFVAFNDEEEGMTGSATYADSTRRSMRGFMNLDMIGNGTNPCVNASYNHGWDEAIATRLADANRREGSALRMPLRRYTVDDQDGSSFWSDKLPVAYLYECADSPHYHRSTDQLQYLNVGQITATTRIVVAALLDLATSAD